MRLRDITCISDINYAIGRWFTVGMVAIAFATLPFALMAWESVVSFLMCACIAFVGCAANYKDRTEYPVHYISAALSALCSVVWVAHVMPWCLLMMMFAVVGIVDRKRWLMWCEVACFGMVYVALLVS